MTLRIPRSVFAAGIAVLLARVGQAVEPTRILIPEAATPAVRAAASEFAKYYREVTGRTLVTSVSRGKAASAVRIGFPEAFGGDCDAYAIRSEGDDLVLAGRNGRSVLYAVYDFFARRAGCRWFWDGDVVPKRDRIDFSGLDVKEASRFRYRGCQYFPHRGLTRFQAEHWGFEDWAREIDWALKNRLNFLMPRHGIGDLFQRAFPESVPYPDPSVTQATDCKPGHNTRSPFWSLQFRSMLHKAVVGYMSEREMLYPVEFGTLTHWFSRTPQEFLEAEKPTFMPQVGNLYGEDSGRVWNVLDPKWFDAYWRLSEASAAAYGDKGIWFTPGFDERLCYTNRADNLRLKKKMIVDYIARLHETRPDAQAVIEGWDIHFAWKPEEVKAMLPELDPARTTIFDFTADARFNKNEFVPMGNNFTLWGVTNSFPYTFGFMLAFNRGNDIRADYGVIRERQKAIANDPMCRGYLLWPECSHSDIFAWRYFTANCWNPSGKDVPELLHEFCADRYGRDAAAFEAIWADVIPFSSCQDWGGMYPYFLTHELRVQWNDRAKWLAYGTPKGLENAGRIFRALAAIRWEGTFVRRDTIDLARTTGDRLLTDALARLLKAFHAHDAAEVAVQARRCRALSEALADTLALHEDYSLNESLDRLDRIEKIRNPDFEHVLFDNAADYYSRSHHAELARHWYVPETDETCAILQERARKGDWSPLPEGVTRRFEELRLLAHPIRSLAVAVPRTAENYRKTMEAFAGAAK